MSEFIIGVDLGGTRLRAARLDRHLNIVERTEKLTQATEGRDAVIERIKTIIRTVLPDDDSPVLGIGISVPGPTNPETGVVVAPPNLPGWHDVPLSDILEHAFGLPVYLGNDANVAALAEAALGSARGYRHSIYLTVSTGIGGGIINDGRLILGRAGLANEVGHMAMLIEGDHVSTLELEAAGPALARQAVARLKEGAESLLWQRCGGDLDQVDAKMVGDAANEGDPLAVEVVKRGGKVVGMGVASLLHIFNPEVIVIGGGVSYIGDLWFNEIRAAVKQYTIDDDYWKDTPIIPSEISEDVSILGAATLVLTDGNRKPLRVALDAIESGDESR